MANDDATTSSSCPPAVERRRRVQPSTPMAMLNSSLPTLGYRLLEVTALTFDQIFDGLPPAPSAVWAAPRSGRANGEVRLKHADGFTVKAKMSKSALVRGDDPVMLTTFQDLPDELWMNGP